MSDVISDPSNFNLWCMRYAGSREHRTLLYRGVDSFAGFFVVETKHSNMTLYPTVIVSLSAGYVAKW